MTEEIEDFGDICDKCQYLCACFEHEIEYCVFDGHYCKEQWICVEDPEEIEKMREEIESIKKEPDPWFNA